MSDGFNISFDGNTSHAIHWARSKAKLHKKYLGKEACDLVKFHYCARIFLEKDEQKTPLIFVAKGYNEEDSIFDVVLSGSKGQYKLALYDSLNS